MSAETGAKIWEEEVVGTSSLPDCGVDRDRTGSPDPSEGVRVVSLLLLLPLLLVLGLASLELGLAEPLLPGLLELLDGSWTGAYTWRGAAGLPRAAAGCCQKTDRSQGFCWS